MLATDDTFTALRTEVAEPLGIPVKGFSGNDPVQHTRRPAGLGGAA